MFTPTGSTGYGTSRTPKVGITWIVADGFQFNASYGKSFRAPSLAESDTFQGGTTSFSSTNQLNYSGAALTTQQAVITVGGGNASLKPETATTKTFGFAWKAPARARTFAAKSGGAGSCFSEALSSASKSSS